MPDDDKKPLKLKKTIDQWQVELTGKSASQVYLEIPVLTERGDVVITPETLQTLEMIGLTVDPDGVLQPATTTEGEFKTVASNHYSTTGGAVYGQSYMITVPAGEIWKVVQYEAVIHTTASVCTRTAEIAIETLGLATEAQIGYAPVNAVDTDYIMTQVASQDQVIMDLGNGDLFIMKSDTVRSRVDDDGILPIYLNAGAEIGARIIDSYQTSDAIRVNIIYQRLEA